MKAIRTIEWELTYYLPIIELGVSFSSIPCFKYNTISRFFGFHLNATLIIYGSLYAL